MFWRHTAIPVTLVDPESGAPMEWCRLEHKKYQHDQLVHTLQSKTTRLVVGFGLTLVAVAAIVAWSVVKNG